MNEPIRVLHISYKMHCAGIEAFIMNLYRHIDRSMVQFDFLVHYSKRHFYDDEIEAMGGRIYRLTVREDNNFLKYFSDLNKFFSQHQEYVIVHAHMESFAMFYMPYVKKAGIPVRIAHSHNNKVDPSFRGFIKNIMNKPFKFYATEYMACSLEAARYLFGNRNCQIIHNAIDAKSFSFNLAIREEVRKELDIQNCLVVGHVGRFNTQKNHMFLINVMQKLTQINPEAILISIGEGSLLEDIKKKVRHLGLQDKVRFLGVRADINRLYQAMDIFVFPSRYEGLGIAMIEAQAAGLPVVCSDVIPFIAHITDNIRTLSLAEYPEKWAEAINMLKFGYARKNMFEQIKAANFDIAKVAEDLQEYYLRKDNNCRGEIKRE